LEHGFVKALYKKCRLNHKKLEDCTAIEVKKASGAKCTETQLEKLSKKETYRGDLNADLGYLDLFLKNHVEPQVPEAVNAVEEQQQEEQQVVEPLAPSEPEPQPAEE
jgi:hypothetical protein